MFEIINADTKSVVFDGFKSVDAALKRIKLCKFHNPNIRLRVRRTN